MFLSGAFVRMVYETPGPVFMRQYYVRMLCRMLYGNPGPVFMRQYYVRMLCRMFFVDVMHGSLVRLLYTDVMLRCQTY